MVDPAHLVGVGGIVGAVLRYLVGEALRSESFPLGTLTVNVLGSFGLGFVAFLGAGDDTLLLVGAGACGSFTTFSSFSVDVVRLWEEGERRTAVVYAGANLAGALAAIVIARVVTRGL